MRARFFAQNLRRFVNSDVIIGEISNAITLNRYAYANGNPVSNVDPFGLSVLDWVNGITKVAVTAVAVGAAVAVIAGTGGTAAPIVFGVAASAAVGGYFNEQAGGNFFSGAIGGATSSLIQLGTGKLFGVIGNSLNVVNHSLGITENALQPVGITLGGGLGSGVGTFVTEGIDNLLLPKEERKPVKEIVNDSLQSAGVALVTSSVTGLTDFLTLANTPGTTQMPNWSNTCNNVLSSVMSVVDDASTYIILNNRK